MSLAIEGYTSGGPVGFGARGSAVTVVGSDGAPAVAVAIDDDDRAASLRRLAHLRNAGLPVIVEIAPARSGGYALVMEPVSGPNLATLIEARGSLSAAEAAELWRVLADALAALHSHGIVHGDVSPPNVIIGKDGPVLLDIAGHAGREVGRLGYVPPEVEAGGRPGTESDVWSLARIISWASGEDPEVVRALGAALAEDPDARPSARSFATWYLSLPSAVPISIPEAARLAGAQLRAESAPTLLVDEHPGRSWLSAALVASALVAATILVKAGDQPAAGNAAGREPAQAVSELLLLRDRAITDREPALLEEIYTADAAALQADRQLLQSLVDGDVTVSGYATTIGAISAVDCGQRYCLEATIGQQAYERHGPDGTQTVPEAQGQCVRLRLEDGRVAELSSCAG